MTATLGDATRNPVQIAPKRNVAAQESFDRSRAHESPTSSCLWALRLLTAILRDKSVPQAMNVGARAPIIVYFSGSSLIVQQVARIIQNI